MAYAFQMRAGLSALASLAVVLPHVATAETHRVSSRSERLMIPLGAEGPSNPILPQLRDVERSIELAREAQSPRLIESVTRARSAQKPIVEAPVPFTLAAFPTTEAEDTRRPWPRTVERVPQSAPIVLAAREGAPARSALRAALPWAAAPAVPPLLTTPADRARTDVIARIEVPAPSPRRLSAKGGPLRLPLVAQRHRLSTRVAFATSKPGAPEPRVPTRSTDPIGNPFDSFAARPVASGPAYIMPFENGRVTSLFNQGRHHPAIDLAGRHGSPVYATSHGQTVIFAGSRGGYGNAVITRDREGREHLYGHLSAINTRPGVTLAQGDRLGALGSTGYSTGPHVHYEVKDRRGAHINPVSLLFPRGVSAGYAWAGTGLVRGATQQAALAPPPPPPAAAQPQAAPPQQTAAKPAPAIVRAQVNGSIPRANRTKARRLRDDEEE